MAAESPTRTSEPKSLPDTNTHITRGPRVFCAPRVPQSLAISDFPDRKEGFYPLVQTPQLVLKRDCECIMALTEAGASRFRPSLHLFMRIVSRLAISFLIWPISLVAQDSPPPGQPDPPVQGPAGAQNFVPSSDATPAPSPPPTPVLIPQPARTPAFLYLRPIKQPPVAPAYASFLNVSAGYSITNLGMPSSGRVSLSGVNASICAETGKRLGVKLDLGYSRAPNVYSTGHRMDVLSYLVGPVFFISDGNVLGSYAHLLVGGARVAGPFPNASGGLNTGYVHYPAWGFGGGAEYRLSPTFGFRVNIDYLRTHFFDSSGTARGQSDLRVVNSIVYYLGVPRIKHHQ